MERRVIMSNQTQFKEVAKRVLPTLTQYVPVVDRVHGDHHPEFHEVRRLFNLLSKKVKESYREMTDKDIALKIKIGKALNFQR